MVVLQKQIKDIKSYNELGSSIISKAMIPIMDLRIKHCLLVRVKYRIFRSRHSIARKASFAQSTLEDVDLLNKYLSIQSTAFTTFLFEINTFILM